MDTDELIVPVTQIPRGQGGAWLRAQRKPRSWTLSGGFTSGAIPNVTAGTVRNAIDALKFALMSGPANFYLDSDRYWRNVQLESAPTNWETYYGLFGTMELKLTAADPYAYSTSNITTADLHSGLAYHYVCPGDGTHHVADTTSGAPATGTWSTGDFCWDATGAEWVCMSGGTPGTWVLATGNAFALPAWYLRADQTLGTAFSWTWTNSTTNEVVSLAGDWPISGAGYLIVDALGQTVVSRAETSGTPGPGAVMSAATDRFGLFEGQFPSLRPGANSFAISDTGFAPTGVWAVYAGRWL
jgi:hypothetical protein